MGTATKSLVASPPVPLPSAPAPRRTLQRDEMIKLRNLQATRAVSLYLQSTGQLDVLVGLFVRVKHASRYRLARCYVGPRTSYEKP